MSRNIDSKKLRNDIDGLFTLFILGNLALIVAAVL